MLSYGGRFMTKVCKIRWVRKSDVETRARNFCSTDVQVLLRRLRGQRNENIVGEKSGGQLDDQWNQDHVRKYLSLGISCD